MSNYVFRLFTKVFATIFLVISLSQTAGAGIISTQELLAGNGTDRSLSAKDVGLLRTQVAEVLVEQGVPSLEAIQRANALTYTELSSIQSSLDSLPAGQGAIGVLGVLFLVLIVLELVGVTNIFNSF